MIIVFFTIHSNSERTQSRHFTDSSPHKIYSWQVLSLSWRALSSLNRLRIIGAGPLSPSYTSAEHVQMYTYNNTIYVKHIYTIILLKSVCQPSQTSGRNSCSIISGEMSLTVPIVWQYILSRVRVSVRPSIFLYAKNIHKLSRRPAVAQLSVEWKGA